MQRLIQFVTLAVLLVVLGPDAVAQEQRPEPQGAGAQLLSGFETGPVAIDFPGGSVAEYYKLIERKKPACSFVLGRDVERVAMPPLKLSHTRLADAILVPQRIVPGIGVSMVSAPTAPGGNVLPIFAVTVDPRGVRDWLTSAPDRINVEIAAGTVSEYLAALRKASPGLNAVVASPEAGSMRIPAVTLKSATVEEAVLLLGAMPAGENHLKLDVVPVGDVFVVREFLDKPGSAESRVWTQSLQNLTQLGARTEDVLSAIDAAMSVVEQPAQIKYHRETGLLIVRGNEESVNAVSSVVTQLFEQAVKNREKK